MTETEGTHPTKHNKVGTPKYNNLSLSGIADGSLDLDGKAEGSSED